MVNDGTSDSGPDSVTITANAEAEEEGDEADGGKRKAFVGEVQGEPGELVTLIQQGKGETVNIGLPEGYQDQVRTPGGPRAGTFGDGAKVVILARWANDRWEGMWVLVKPVKPPQTLTGSVVSIEDGIVTIMRRNGTTKTLQLPSGVEAPAVGELVTAFPDDRPGKGGLARAKGLVNSSQVRDRLLKLIEDLTIEDGELPAKALEARERRVNFLSKLLENHGARKVEVLNKALDRVERKAQASIQRAIAKAEKGRQEAKDAIKRAKEKVGPLEGRGPPAGLRRGGIGR